MSTSSEALRNIAIVNELERLVNEAKQTLNPLTAKKLANKAENIMISAMPGILKQLIADMDQLKGSTRHE